MDLHEAREIAVCEDGAVNKRLPDFLNTAHLDETWRVVETIPTHSVFKWFEEQVRCHHESIVYVVFTLIYTMSEERL